MTINFDLLNWEFTSSEVEWGVISTKTLIIHSSELIVKVDRNSSNKTEVREERFILPFDILMEVKQIFGELEEYSKEYKENDQNLYPLTKVTGSSRTTNEFNMASDEKATEISTRIENFIYERMPKVREFIDNANKEIDKIPGMIGKEGPTFIGLPDVTIEDIMQDSINNIKKQDENNLSSNNVYGHSSIGEVMFNSINYSSEEEINQKIKEVIAKLLNKTVEEVTDEELYLATQITHNIGGYNEKTNTYWDGKTYLSDEEFIIRANRLNDYLKAGYDISAAAHNTVTDYNEYISNVFKFDNDFINSNEKNNDLTELKEKYPSLFDEYGNITKNGVQLIDMLIENYAPQLSIKENNELETSFVR